jgi:transposase
MGDCGGRDRACEAWRSQALLECPQGAEQIFYILRTGCQWKALPKDLPGH